MSDDDLAWETEWGLRREFDGSVLTHWPSREAVERVIEEERADEFGIACSLVSRRVGRSQWRSVE